MDYGAKMLQWAPFAAENAETAGKLPTYGPAVNLGSLNKVSDTPAFNEAKGYGDNVLKVYVNKFKETVIAVEVTEVPRDQMAAISGCEIEEGDHKNMRFQTTDAPPYGGMGFFVNKILDDGRDVFMGVFYPKVKAMLQGTEYNTNDWRIYSDYFEKEADAVAWLNGMFTGESTSIGKDPVAGASDITLDKEPV